MSSNLVEHRKTDLVVWHMSRFLKLDDFCPIWTRFSSLWSTLTIVVKFLYFNLQQHRKTDLLMCHMPRFLKFDDFCPIWTRFSSLWPTKTTPVNVWPLTVVADYETDVLICCTIGLSFQPLNDIAFKTLTRVNDPWMTLLQNDTCPTRESI